MSVSFTITAAPIYRTFTKEQSSAIYNIEIDQDLVEIIFHSNTDKAYLFSGSDRFIAHLTEVIKSPDLLGFSLGSLVAKARKNGDLQIIQFSED
ncbi:MAG: hypothetical protein ACO3EZ_14435 [Prochlorotrichaceae cyanobacterium]